ncbi:long-chain-fatty-acid--CoA ligase [Mobilicoccus pelagius]|uniref:Putative long-chain fatty-acid--CoA ligase n=1 Tax=Mobilicoccus pelagius NBRC 104925 TaxID=1089455 RepID=H5UU74_9MICO|nr:long-chain fatty acid--CoA ligase [Mobilicoccus pelagius]GAB49282.1 putative long-chain fatty-acid--CoA ligase [Mobilicoccus pelagius NBRC 104925]
MANLAENLLASAHAHPDLVAVREGEAEITYAELDRLTARGAGWLRSQGIGPGEPVVLSLPNVTAYVVAYYAVLRAGGVVVPMNPLFRPREVEYYLSDSGARLIIGATPDSQEGARQAGATCLSPADLTERIVDAEPLTEVTPRDDEDTAVLLYTSGTTGHPKGAELRHRNLRTNADTVVRTLVHLTPEDTVVGCLPLFHVFGMTCALNAPILAGSTLTLIPRFSPDEAMHVIERDRATIFEGVPTMYAAILQAARTLTGRGEPLPDVSSLRTCVSGGASLPVEVLHAFESTFDAIILEGYGLSETSPVVSFNHPDRERKPGSIGTPIEGVEMGLRTADGRLVEEGSDEVGEIVIRGNGLMRGYWKRPETTAEAIDAEGWFHSGDLARRDADGYYVIVDRAKDLIIRGGYNVYPREVEEVLYEHPDVLEAAVIGVPHEHYGEEISAFVALRPDGALVAGEDAAAQIREFCKARLAPYKYPRVIRFVEALPKGATGKILKRELPTEKA